MRLNAGMKSSLRPVQMEETREDNPSFATILKVTRALGLTLQGGPLAAADAKSDA